jgi:hypothetical protein
MPFVMVNSEPRAGLNAQRRRAYGVYQIGEV